MNWADDAIGAAGIGALFLGVKCAPDEIQFPLFLMALGVVCIAFRLSEAVRAAAPRR